ncbi:hypothetical protein [Flavobacterium sp.]|uniref:hypothetical protein n=1 Tax=Flavobacterium sp. TaxID=239 RepID=UPI0012281277|nr:hypothetical protein [Flavobacterium sp.]RZJ71603.1 MAG: hypothetical protein EOO49_09605 [Flavobacterium sp.]
MKSTFLALIAFFGIAMASAQNNPEKQCKALQRSVDSLVNTNDAEKAYAVWLNLRKVCPNNEKTYTTGFDLLRLRIQKLKDDEKTAGVKELLKLYDDFNKNVPANTSPVLMNKAMAMQKYKAAPDEEIYNLLDIAYSKNPMAFADTDAIYLYHKLYYDKFKAGDKTITPNKILRKTDDLVAHVEKLTVADEKSKKANERLARALRNLVKDVSTCENLDAYYGEVFEKRKSDTLWLAVALDALAENNCRNSKLFQQVTDLQQSTKPSAKSAYNAGSAAYQKADFANAAKYFIQSAELSKDPSEKADTYFTLASTIYVGRDKAKQKEFALKALEVKKDYAKSYILLAQLYAESGSECGKSEFEKKALNLLAIETLKKAISVNKNMGGLDKVIKSYEKKAPTQKEIKDAKMGGKTVHFDCWINESVLIPEAK